MKFLHINSTKILEFFFMLFTVPSMANSKENDTQLWF